MGKRIAVDSNVLTYLIEANTRGYDPETDPDLNLAPERVVAFRLFLQFEVLYLLPTVRQEIEPLAGRDVALWSEHASFGSVLLDAVQGLDERAVRSRAQVYYQHHRRRWNDWNYCMIVAEAELAGLDVLLTFDGDLRENLRDRTPVRLRTPSMYWRELALPRGTPPKWILAATHPLYKATWWRCE